MVVDFLIAGALALFAFRGQRSGTIKQLTHWAGMSIGRFVGKPLALILTLALAPDLGFPPVGVRVAISVLCFYTLYVVGTVIVQFLTARFSLRKKKKRM